MALGYSAFVTPHGNVAPAINGSNFTATFNNTADFTHGPGETCAAGEYRQLVQGELKVDGSAIDFFVCPTSGTRLSPIEFRQDGCSPPVCTAYGYRVCPEVPINSYTPDRATGSHYAMSDTPGFRNIVSGRRYGLDVQFRGKLVNTVTNNELVAQDWSVVGEAVAPVMAGEAALTSLSPGDRVMGAHVAANTETGARELHLVLVRKDGQAPLHPTALRVTAKDRRGRAVPLEAEPAVHEVGARGWNTVSIVYPLAAEASLPVLLEVGGPDDEGGIPLHVVHR